VSGFPGFLAVAGLGLAFLSLSVPLRAENLGMLLGPRYGGESYGGIHFEDRIGGGRIDLGVRAMRHRQDLQQRDLEKRKPYSARYRDPADRRGRTAWPNSETTLRGGPTYEGDKSTCHPVDKVDLDADGKRQIFSGTRCYDGYGEPNVLKNSYRQREYR